MPDQFHTNGFDEDTCPVYNGKVSAEAKYCPECGTKIKKSNNIVPINNAWISFVFVLLMVALILFAEKYYPVYNVERMVMTDLFLAIFAVSFVLIDARSLASLFDISAIRWGLMLRVLVFSLLGGLLISGILWEVQEESVELVYFMVLEDSPSAIWLTILSLGFVPGIFEELAFRGFLQGRLERFLSPFSAMLVCGSVFAIVHLHAISLIWLVPLGLYTSWLRMKSGLIWYSIVVHLVYNSTITFYDYYRYLEVF